MTRFHAGRDSNLPAASHHHFKLRVVIVFHDAPAKAGNDDATQRNLVEYGRRLEEMIEGVKDDLATAIKTS